MTQNNIKILTKKELSFLNEKYSFIIDDTKIIVKVNNYDRATTHNIADGFLLTTTIRRIKISSEAINMWINLTNKKIKCSLFDVQNAINTLTVLYQHCNEDNVIEQLKRDDNKIKIV